MWFIISSWWTKYILKLSKFAWWNLLHIIKNRIIKSTNSYCILLLFSNSEEGSKNEHLWKVIIKRWLTFYKWKRHEIQHKTYKLAKDAYLTIELTVGSLERKSWRKFTKTAARWKHSKCWTARNYVNDDI